MKTENGSVWLNLDDLLKVLEDMERNNDFFLKDFAVKAQSYLKGLKREFLEKEAKWKLTQK
jgi:hypothetical protein